MRNNQEGNANRPPITPSLVGRIGHIALAPVRLIVQAVHRKMHAGAHWSAIENHMQQRVTAWEAQQLVGHSVPDSPSPAAQAFHQEPALADDANAPRPEPTPQVHKQFLGTTHEPSELDQNG